MADSIIRTATCIVDLKEGTVGHSISCQKLEHYGVKKIVICFDLNHTSQTESNFAGSMG